MTQPIMYSGKGQSGNMNDAHNWTGGFAPGAADTAVVMQSAVLNGSFEVGQVMFLGTETITINGALKTDSTNTCQGVMVCDNAVATFEAGSTLNDAGGFITADDTIGTTYVDGASGALAAATLNTYVLKVGEVHGSHGVLNVAGIINNTGGSYVGFGGDGTMNVTGNGQVNLTLGLTVGNMAASVGIVNLSGNAAVTARNVVIGTSIAGAPGGIGTVDVGGSANLNAGQIDVNYGSALVMTGGTVSAIDGNGVQINAGGTASGYGHISSGNGAVVDNGALSSSGGTLVVSGNLNGMGTVQIAAGSTLDVVAGRITVPAISFMGSNATLELTTGVTGAFNIAGFGAGDQLVMNNIDALSWNSATSILTLSEHGQTMDRLHFSAIPANETFHLNLAPAGSVITLMPVMLNH